MKKYWTRVEMQAALEANGLKAEVSYLDREEKSSPDNWVLYMPLHSAASLKADDLVHMRTLTIQVVHLHKQKLDSIAELMLETFQVEPRTHLAKKETQTDYWSTYYEVGIIAGGVW